MIIWATGIFRYKFVITNPASEDLLSKDRLNIKSHINNTCVPFLLEYLSNGAHSWNKDYPPSRGYRHCGGAFWIHQRQTQAVTESLRRPTSRVADPNPGAGAITANAAILTPQYNLGAKSQLRLKDGCDIIRYYETVNRVITTNMVRRKPEIKKRNIGQPFAPGVQVIILQYPISSKAWPL